jgi:hypothetical protein
MLQVSQEGLARRDYTPARPSTLWPELPNITQAHEEARVAIAYGVGLLLFGLAILTFLPKA